MKTFRLPDVGEGLAEAEVVAWHVTPGDHVVMGQPVLSIETDKAIVELPAPESGRVTDCLATVGEIVTVGQALMRYVATDEAEDTGTVVGELPQAAGGPTGPAPRDSAAARPGPAAGRTGAGTPADPARAVHAAPAVRRLARELGVELASVDASGPAGAVLASDVRAVAAAQAGPADPMVRPLRGVRRAMARNMARAGAEVVPATVTDVADIGHWPAGTDVTLRLIVAMAAACDAEPALNTWFLGRDRGRHLHPQVDLGIAMDTPDGLFVPVLRDAGRQAPAELRAALDRMKADVQSRRVPAAELRDASITLSNFGTAGGRHAALVVVPPQVAIVGAGRAYDAPVVRGGAVTVSRLLPLSVTFDHRAVTGIEAAGFLAALLADLQATADAVPP